MANVIGGALLIAGTTIGAGMLALPLAAAELGGLGAAGLMFGLWGVMTYTALLQVEASVATGELHLHRMGKLLLGSLSPYISTTALLFLLYALSAAYISGSSELLQQAMMSWDIDLTVGHSAGVVTVLVAGLVVWGAQAVDGVNRILFVIKLLAMCCVLLWLWPQASAAPLVSTPVNPQAVLVGIPVIFTAFGFHSSIPSVMLYLGSSVQDVRRAFLLGSALPLVIYLLWQGAVLGVMGQDALMAGNGSLDGLFLQLAERTAQPWLLNCLHVFADAALLTSFLGVSLGLFDVLRKLMRRANTWSGRLQTAMLTFVPPLLFALFYPNGFIVALGYAALPLVILAIFFPVGLALRVRQQGLNQAYCVRGGTLPLGIAVLAGVTIIVAQCLTL